MHSTHEKNFIKWPGLPGSQTQKKSYSPADSDKTIIAHARIHDFELATTSVCFYFEMLQDIYSQQIRNLSKSHFFNFCQINKFYPKWRGCQCNGKYLSWYHAFNVPLCNVTNHQIYASSISLGSYIPLPLCHFLRTSLVSPFCKTSLPHHVWRTHLGKFLKLNTLPRHNCSAGLLHYFLKLINNSWRENKGNHYREGGLDMWS